MCAWLVSRDVTTSYFYIPRKDPVPAAPCNLKAHCFASKVNIKLHFSAESGGVRSRERQRNSLVRDRQLTKRFAQKWGEIADSRAENVTSHGECPRQFHIDLGVAIKELVREGFGGIIQLLAPVQLLALPLSLFLLPLPL